MNIEASSIHASPVSAQPDFPHVPVSAPPLDSDISHHVTEHSFLSQMLTALSESPRRASKSVFKACRARLDCHGIVSRSQVRHGHGTCPITVSEQRPGPDTAPAYDRTAVTVTVLMLDASDLSSVTVTVTVLFMNRSSSRATTTEAERDSVSRVSGPRRTRKDLACSEPESPSLSLSHSILSTGLSFTANFTLRIHHDLPASHGRRRPGFNCSA
jgi:hypothetical protein